MHVKMGFDYGDWSENTKSMTTQTDKLHLHAVTLTIQVLIQTSKFLAATKPNLKY